MGFKLRWPKRTDKERFLEKVIKTRSCWIWIGAIHTKKGYGAFYFKGSHQKAHRVSWQLFSGDITSGAHVLHKCDNPQCVNPRHLFLGTNADNIADRIKKGRGHLSARKGINNCKAKLKEEDVLHIRKDTRKKKEIASEYGIHWKTVIRIQKRTLWSHI